MPYSLVTLAFLEVMRSCLGGKKEKKTYILHLQKKKSIPQAISDWDNVIYKPAVVEGIFLL